MSTRERMLTSGYAQPNGKEIRFISDYVLAGYGTGAIMVVPRTTAATMLSPVISTAVGLRSKAATSRRNPMTPKRETDHLN